jgi:hypothetical protein
MQIELSQESQPKDTQSAEERDRERARDDDEEDGHSSTTLRKKEPKLPENACCLVPTIKNRRDMSKGNQNGSKQTIISGR